MAGSGRCGGRRLSCVAALATLLPLLAAPAVADPPFLVGGDPRVDPDDFRVTVFASGLDFPFGMAELADGSLLVAVSPESTPGGGFFDSSGSLIRLVDANGDGVADGPGTVSFSGLPGGLTSLRLSGDLAFVARSQNGVQGISILRLGATPADPLTLLGSIDFAYPVPWQHPNLTLATRPTPGQPGKVDLYFQVGSQENAASTANTVALSGLFAGALVGEAIYKLTVDATGPMVVVSGLTQVVTGVRNPFGLAFDPLTGDLYFEDNGIDPDVGQAQSADELNFLAAADIGGAIEDFGFPDNYLEYRTEVEIGSGGIDPIVAFQPIPPPDGLESEGPTEIALAPPGFPPGLDDGVFVGFHGKFGLAGLSNEENPLVYVDLGTGEYFHFVSNAEPGIGHLDSLLATSDSLFAADWTSVDGFNTAGTGVVYQIKTRVKEVPALPGTALFVAAALALAGGWWELRRRGRRAPESSGGSAAR